MQAKMIKGLGSWSTSEKRNVRKSRVVTHEAMVSKAIHAPSIPVIVQAHPPEGLRGLVKQMRWAWIIPWGVSMLILAVVLCTYTKAYHHSIWTELPQNADVSIYAKGCDISVIPNQYLSSRMSVSWWTSLGDASTEVNGTKVQVKAESVRRSTTWRCRVVLYPNHYHNLLNTLAIKIDPSDAAEFNAGPSNVAEVIEVSLDEAIIKTSLTLDVKTYSEVSILGVQVPQMTANMAGGRLSVHEATSKDAEHPIWLEDEYRTVVHLPKSMDLNLQSATVVVNAHNADMRVKMAQDTVDDAILAGAKVTNIGKDVYELARHKYSKGPYVSVNLEANNCAIYFTATDKEHYFGHKGASGLQVHRGNSTQQGPRLLPIGVAAMKELSNWLNKTSITDKFMVYFDIAAPHAPAGTFRLLSTRSYLAFSMSDFVMMSAGMLNPTVIRITTPLVGLNFLFPRTLNEGLLSKAENEEYVKGLFQAVTKEVDIFKVGKPYANWVWDPIGPDVYLFDYHPPKNDRPASWVYRLTTAADTYSFRLCAYITALLGVILGGILCTLIVYELKPYILALEKHKEVVASSTYQLKYQVLPYDWNVNSTFVSYPTTGIILKWAKRPKQDQFVSMRIMARRWPVQQHLALLTTDCNPALLPSPPSAPDQQAFLFPARPRDQSERNKKVVEPICYDFDDYLAATARTVFSDAKLDVGKAFMFKCQAYNNASCSGQPIDVANWTRPVVIRAEPVCTEYPLILWKTLCGFVPSDPFQYFLDKHCCPVTSAPSMTLTLSAMKLVVINDSTLFCGAANTYGQGVGMDNTSVAASLEALGSDEEKVRIVVSTGADEQIVEDNIFSESDLALLPGMYAKKRTENVKTFKEATGLDAPSASSDPSLKSKKFLIVDFDKECGKPQTIPLHVGQDMEQFVRIEAVKGTDSSGDDFKQTARYQTTWHDLVTTLIKNGEVTGKAGQTQFHINDWLIMRDGLSASAFLMVDIELTNTVIEGGLPQATAKTNFPQVFTHVLPGSTLLWGEDVMLHWPKQDKNPNQRFDIEIHVQDLYHLTSAPVVSQAERDTVVLKNVDLEEGHAHVKVAPLPTPDSYCFLCYFTAVVPDDSKTILATSSKFVVVKPVTLQGLEVGYSSFCVRNQMAMQPFGDIVSLQLNNGLDIVQRSFSTISHYRHPLPIEYTGEPECYAYSDYKLGVDGPPMIENGGSYLIVGDRPIKIHHMDMYEVVESTSSALDSEEGSKEANKIEKLPVSQSQMIDIPTNLFWKSRTDSDWSSELLLLWGCLPTFAREGWVKSYLTNHGMPQLGKYLDWTDNVIRFVLQMFLWWLQMIVLLSPVWLLLVCWTWHDNLVAEFNPNMGASASETKSSLFSFLISPSLYKWEKLQQNTQTTFLCAMIYSIAVLALIVYGNFVHHSMPVAGIWVPLNLVVSFTYMATLFGLVFYASLALCWILMGSLVNPEQLMPYALMAVGLMVTVRTNWTNLQGMKQQALDGLMSKLDIVTRAIMTIFIGKAGEAAAGAAVQESEAALAEYASNLCAYLKSAETSAKQLYWQGSIILDVNACDRDATLLLRESPGFKAGLGEDVAKNKVYATDFVPQKYWADAQKRANDSHVIDNTRQQPYKYLVDGQTAYPDELIEIYDLHEAAAIDSLKGLDANSGDADAIQMLAKKLGMRPKTAAMVHQAFGLANGTASETLTSMDQIVNAPLLLGPIMKNVREKTLFELFLHKGVTEEDMKQTSEQVAVAEQQGKKSIGCSIIHSYITEMDRKELENLNAVVAGSLTTILDWTKISRKAAHFSSDTLPCWLVIQAIENQLNPVINGSAAFRVKRTASEKVFEKFGDVYSKNPNQFFVDCGIVEEKFAKDHRCQKVLTAAVANFRAFDGSIDQIGLLKALDWLILPTARVTNAGAGGIISKLYLWKDALLSILKDLGWNDDEMEEDWLNSAWMAETKSKGVFPYEDIAEISTLICTNLCDSGLWKAAMKVFCFNVKIGGYLGCDIKRSSYEDATKLAHQILNGNNDDLNFVNSIVRWPEWVKDVWNTLAEQSSIRPTSGGAGPRFLQLQNMDDFLEALVYQSVDKKTEAKITKTQMNKYPVNANDLQWYLGEDHGIWQVTPEGNKRIRGIWMELYMSVCDAMDCLPNDLDLFLNNMSWQLKKDKETPTLKFDSMGTWLTGEYIGAQRKPGTFALTFRQFNILLSEYMDFVVPTDVLSAQVFLPCPTVPGDDLGELRYAHDLGAALRIWIGYGVWKGAVKEVIKQMCPRGATQALALKLLPDEFDKLDDGNVGILQPGQLKMLLQKLMHPGLTLPEVTLVIQKDLGLNIPEREVHKYFCTIDINGDGVLQATEFVSFIRVIMTNFYPQEILNYLGFSTMAILKIVITFLVCLIGLFVAITLVIKSFASGPVAATIHSSCSAGSSYLVKLQSDSTTGAGQAMSEIMMHVDSLVMLAITGLLGLAPSVVDELKQLFAKLL